MRFIILNLLLLVSAVAVSGCASMRSVPLSASNEAPTASRTLPYGQSQVAAASKVDTQGSQLRPSGAMVQPIAVTETEAAFLAAAGEQTNCWLASFETSATSQTASDFESALPSKWVGLNGPPPNSISDWAQPLAPGRKDITYQGLVEEQWTGILSDYAEFYSPQGLTWLAGGVGVGALMANTGFDEHFVRDTYFENVVLAPSDELYENLHQPKFLGDGFYTIPIFAIAALAEPLIYDLPLGSETAEWGQRSLRTILVGGPPMLGLQLLTGGSRPGETSAGSKWKPFQDDNGVSGHSFMGAIPFMSAAKMTDNIWLKGGLYAASTLPALSRVNDDRHYFSQAFLGWWLAYLAETAVDHSHDPNASYRFFAYPEPGGVGIGFEYVH